MQMVYFIFNHTLEEFDMPVYRFVCEDCGKTFEKKLEFSEVNTKQACPNGHMQVRRLFNTPAVVFKGSGWYSTDHRKASHSDTNS